MNQRDLYLEIWRELSASKSMIFLTGPRQAGKTTLARLIGKSFANFVYFNWDIGENRARFIENPSFFTEINRKDSSIPFIVFDEVHKYKTWKNYLKGVYDQHNKTYKFLISGSGRLDLYQKGSDSLAGRYFLFHLWPFTIAELGGANRNIEDFLKNPLQISMDRNEELKKIWERLEKLSGFPEPYSSERLTIYRRWSNTYAKQLIREDIRDMTDVRLINEMETLYFMLPSKVGSPLSTPSFARDLKVSYNSIQSWLSVLDSFYLLFSISPWTSKISRSIQKEHKVYLWDTPRIKDPAARFENMVAQELYRAATSWTDMGYGVFSLHYIVNKERQEVDFLIANDNEPLLLIEAKLSDKHPSTALKKFQNRLNIPAVQLIKEGASYQEIPNGTQNILVSPASQWLAQLP